MGLKNKWLRGKQGAVLSPLLHQVQRCPTDPHRRRDRILVLSGIQLDSLTAGGDPTVVITIEEEFSQIFRALQVNNREMMDLQRDLQSEYDESKTKHEAATLQLRESLAKAQQELTSYYNQMGSESLTTQMGREAYRELAQTNLEKVTLHTELSAAEAQSRF